MDYESKLKQFKHINVDKTREQFGIPVQAKGLVVTQCTSCGTSGQMNQNQATQKKYLTSPYVCRSCASIRRESVNWQERCESLPHYRSAETLERFGYSYPRTLTDKAVIQCTGCQSIHERTLHSVWHESKHTDYLCTTCAPANLSPEAKALKAAAFSKVVKKYWEDPAHKQQLKDRLKLERGQRSDNFKRLNKDPDFQKTRLDALNKPEPRLSQAKKLSKYWEENYDKMRAATLASAPARIIKLKQHNANPLVKSQQSAAGRIRWETPSYREKQLARWTPEARKAFSERMKLTHANGARRYLNNRPTEPERIMRMLLNDLNLKHEFNFPDGPYLVDFYVPELKLFIEVQGLKFHHPEYVEGNAVSNIARDKSKNTYFTRKYPDHQYWCVWDHEMEQPGFLLSKFKEHMTPQQFDFNDVEIRAVEKKQARSFYSLYHYLGNARYSYVELGAFLNGKLIGLAQYSYVQRPEIATSMGYKPKELVELSRFCISPCYHKKNFGSWLLAKTKNIINERYPQVRAIVSFADTTVGHQGTIYKAANYQHVSEVPADYWYVHEETGYRLHKRTLWQKASKLRVTESEFAKTHGFKKVYGGKKIKYLLEL